MDSVSVGLVGGGAGFLAFLMSMSRIMMADRSWRDILGEVRKDLVACADERSSLRREVDGLRSEVVVLRNELHASSWKRPGKAT